MDIDWPACYSAPVPFIAINYKHAQLLSAEPRDLHHSMVRRDWQPQYFYSSDAILFTIF